MAMCYLDGMQWKPMGKGCNRNPHSAFSFLANMVYQRKTSLQSMLACESIKEVTRLLEVSATPYWQMRSHFGAESKRLLSDGPSEAFCRSESTFLEMITLVPLQYLFTIQQFVHPLYTFSDTCHYRILCLLLLVTKAQIHPVGLYLMTLNKLYPSREPHRRRGSND